MHYFWMTCITFWYFVNQPWVVILLWYMIQTKSFLPRFIALRKINHFLCFFLYLLLLFSLEYRNEKTERYYEGKIVNPFISQVVLEIMRKWTFSRRPKTKNIENKSPWHVFINAVFGIHVKWPPSFCTWEVLVHP